MWRGRRTAKWLGDLHIVNGLMLSMREAYMINPNPTCQMRYQKYRENISNISRNENNI